MRVSQKLVYHYRFSPFQLEPLLEAQPLLEDELMERWSQQEALVEQPVREEKKEMSVSIAEAEGEAATRMPDQVLAPSTTAEKERREVHTYTLTYYNPETHKTEVLSTTMQTRAKDIAQQMIEEAAGMGTTYRLYSYIATPLAREEVVPYLLERILNEREYDVPPPFGGAAVVKVAPKSDKRATVIRAEETRSALVETLKRKEEVEEKLEQALMQLEEAVEMLREGNRPGRALRQLEGLTRARFLALVKQKKVDPEVLILLLEKDIRFLRAIKKKLQHMTTPDLVELLGAMRQLRERK